MNEAILGQAFQPTVLTTNSNTEESSFANTKENAETPPIAPGVKSADPLRDVGGAEEEEEPFWPWLKREADVNSAPEQARAADESLPWAPAQFLGSSDVASVDAPLPDNDVWHPFKDPAIDAYFAQAAGSDLRDDDDMTQWSGVADVVPAPEESSHDGGWVLAGLAAALGNGFGLRRENQDRRGAVPKWGGIRR